MEGVAKIGIDRRSLLWIFTHELTPKAAAVRFADIEARRNPTQPYEGLEIPEGLDEIG